jgi:hypothetical protein
VFISRIYKELSSLNNNKTISFLKMGKRGWMWHCMPVIPALGKLRPAWDIKFEQISPKQQTKSMQYYRCSLS